MVAVLELDQIKHPFRMILLSQYKSIHILPVNFLKPQLLHSYILKFWYLPSTTEMRQVISFGGLTALLSLAQYGLANTYWIDGSCATWLDPITRSIAEAKNMADKASSKLDSGDATINFAYGFIFSGNGDKNTVGSTCHIFHPLSRFKKSVY
jgi:hypothetical protein